MKNSILISLSILLSLLVFNQSFAQEVAQPEKMLSRIEMKEGNFIIGTIISETNDEITVETTTMGTVNIKRSDIKSIQKLDASRIKKGEYWFPNSNSTRYLFGPTGRNLEKGEGYFQNILIFFNSANYGITDWFSIGAGFESLSTFSGNPIILITPKIGFNITEKLSAGGGFFYLNAVGFDVDVSGGIAYGVVTYGSKDSNASLGTGWGFFRGDFGSEPVISLAGMHRVSRRLSLISENWFFPGADSYFLTYGIRFMGERIAVDWASFIIPEIFEAWPLGIPLWVSFQINF